MIKKIIPKFLRKKISSVWYANFLQQRIEAEKCMPKYELHQQHIQNFKIILNRELLLNSFPKNAVCAEIGVNTGDFSELILKHTKPVKLHLIDAWGDPLRYHDGLKDMVRGKFKKEIEQKVVELNIGYSTNVLKEFPDQYFDWVYLDTTHTYNVTSEELIILKDKVKPDGIIAGHDYIIGNWAGDCRYGVIEAVHEFCVKNNWQLIHTTANIIESPSFAIKKII